MRFVARRGITGGRDHCSRELNYGYQRIAIGCSELPYYVMRSIVVRTMSDAVRLSTEALLSLVSLADGAKHGYAIQQDIQVVSGRRLGPGTLYGAIARLEGAGLIEAMMERGARRPYRLTPEGTKQLRAELESLKGLTRAGTRRLAAR
jgi:DNA-binding transcriptional ArsR family regulator